MIPLPDTTCGSDGWAVTSDQKKAEERNKKELVKEMIDADVDLMKNNPNA
ncbi:UNVERIFIED_CONTAM: hypothetical protein FKN15_074804 [Acipenser sinensis]